MTTSHTTGTTGAILMDAIRQMLTDAGSLPAGTMLTDCIILTRTEPLASDGRGKRGRWHPMGHVDDARERGLLGQHMDDVVMEDRQRR